MFGRRKETAERIRPDRAAPPAREVVSPEPALPETSVPEQGTRPETRLAAKATASAPPPPQQHGRPAVTSEKQEAIDKFYRTKDSVYDALIEMIDITQLSEMSREKAEEEVTDIVKEIIQVRRLSLPIVEQDILLRQICEDLLGFGPLDPLAGAR